jgi:hypothetical protein
MSINDLSGKIKSFYFKKKDYFYSQEKGFKISTDLFIVLLVCLVATASFGLGKLSALEKKKTPIQVLKVQDELLAGVVGKIEPTLKAENSPTVNYNFATALDPQTSKGIVLASKSGKRYYYPWCTGVDRIKEENKVWFATIEDAKKAGLTPASGCAGLK